MRIWPWSAIRALRRDVRATRLSDSANAQRANRYLARIHLLENACAKHKAQERHDQAYIDALETLLTPKQIGDIRQEQSP